MTMQQKIPTMALSCSMISRKQVEPLNFVAWSSHCEKRSVATQLFSLSIASVKKVVAWSGFLVENYFPYKKLGPPVVWFRPSVIFRLLPNICRPKLYANYSLRVRNTSNGGHSSFLDWSWPNWTIFSLQTNKTWLCNGKKADVLGFRNQLDRNWLLSNLISQVWSVTENVFLKVA